ILEESIKDFDLKFTGTFFIKILKFDGLRKCSLLDQGAFQNCSKVGKKLVEFFQRLNLDGTKFVSADTFCTTIFRLIFLKNQQIRIFLLKINKKYYKKCCNIVKKVQLKFLFNLYLKFTKPKKK
ncbi:hypothetical protein BpHYR1_045212, partial [Brachionus plicatilis]